MRMMLVSFIGFLAVSACNMPFDTSPNTPSQQRRKSPATDAVEEKPAPSSPFSGYRFFFDGTLPSDWYVSARGDDGTLRPGYSALCVVSRKGGGDKVLFLLASSVDTAEREEVKRHMLDAGWWQERIPVSFFDASRVGADVGLHVTKGQFAGADTMLLFTVLRCPQDSCPQALTKTNEIASSLKLRSARADDEHVVSPSAEDCGFRF